MAGEGFDVRPDDLVAGSGSVTQAGTALAAGRATSTGAAAQAAGACGGGALAAALGEFGSGLDGAAGLLGAEMELTAAALTGAAALYRGADSRAASGIASVEPGTGPEEAP